MDKDPAIGEQQKLEDRSGLSQSTVSRILNCHGSATLDSIEALARACNCEPWELLADTEETRAAYIRKALGG